MTATPFNQRIRIWGLRLFFVLALPLILFSRSAWSEPEWVFDILEVSGIALVIAGVLGRFWAILYIGAMKNRTVMQEGPYSICRHPLYLSSTLGVAGFGLLLGSVAVAALMALAVFAILYLTAGREEAFLRQQFGQAYADYAARVPRILPRPALFSTPAQITVDIKPLAMTWADALVFLGFLPVALMVDWLRAAEWLPMLTLP